MPPVETGVKKNQNLPWSRDLGVLNCTSKYLCFRSSTHPYVLPTCRKYNSTEHLVYNKEKSENKKLQQQNRTCSNLTQNKSNQVIGKWRSTAKKKRWIDHWKQRWWTSGIGGEKKEWILKGDFFLKKKSSFTHFLWYKRRINEYFCERDFSLLCDDLFGLVVVLVAVVFGPRPQIVITYRADSGPGVVLLILLFCFF